MLKLFVHNVGICIYTMKYSCFTYHVLSYTSLFYDIFKQFFYNQPKHNLTNSIVSWHQVDSRLVLDTRLLLEACIRDPASIRTIDLDPWLVLETQLLFETRLLLEV